MKKLIAICALVFTAIFFAGCVNVNFQQNANGTNFSLNVQNVSLPNVSLPGNNETPNPTWGPWSSTPMPETPSPTLAPAAFKYSAQVALEVTKRTHRLPSIQRTNNVADERFFKASLIVILQDDRGSPVENASVTVDGRLALKPTTNGMYATAYTIPGTTLEEVYDWVQLINESYYSSTALAPGRHTLEVSVDGQPAGSYDFNVIGLTVSEPAYGAHISQSGFDVKWSEANPINDSLYEADFWNVASYTDCSGDSTLTKAYAHLGEKFIHLAASDFEGSANPELIDSGIYGVEVKAAQLHLPQTSGDTAFSFTAEESDSLDVVAGSVNQCCDPFGPPCAT